MFHLQELGCECILYEDNKSTITLVQNGNPTSKGTKHVKMKYFFIHQHIDNGDMRLEYCNTEDMIADLMTKPLVGGSFNKLKELVVCNIE